MTRVDVLKINILPHFPLWRNFSLKLLYNRGGNTGFAQGGGKIGANFTTTW